jgi:2-polyprenyl-3-methyl-5-hydroxy-6-metoxy-1,4-benzoquinol methylase
MDPDNNSVILKSNDDVYTMLDEIVKKWDSGWWDRFYSDKSRPVPFFRCIPDENLHAYVQDHIFRPGRVLDIGCGPGRNAIYLAKCGFSVDAIDFSAASIAWAKENAKKEHARVNFICDSIFNYTAALGSYDYIYDCGCLHHLKPHRRFQYLKIVFGLLKPGGYFGLACFNPKGSAPLSDYAVYQEGTMRGGMGYTEQKLKAVLVDYFEILEFRQMKEIKDGDLFGEDFLWAVLMKKK